MTQHIFSYYNHIFPLMWNEPALTDYNGTVSYTFGELAQQISQVGEIFRAFGIKRGDKIALCGRNSANWATAYLSIAAYGAVIVSILQDFTGEDIQNLVSHSDAKLLMVGPYVQKQIDITKMPNLQGVVSLADFSIISSINSDLQVETAPTVTPDTFHLNEDNIDDLMLINYTSGSMGQPKGVMLSYRSLSGNVAAGMQFLPNRPGDKLVSMLPLAHMFGQLAEFLFPLAGGCHIYFLTKTPTPTILMKAFQDVQPYMVVTVPLIIEKICQRMVFPAINRKVLRFFYKLPVTKNIIRRTIRKKLIKAFGAKLRYFIIGGAALNPEVEELLHEIHFPFTVGYGMTECGPLIGGNYIDKTRKHSAGHILPRNEIKIDSNDPYNEVGEILVKGEHVMLGYYKNEKATKQAFTADGWMRTGDLGLIDKDNYIYIKGRNKSMILGASGQNIYPEEIEDKLKNMEGVAETLVVQREGKLVALVFPDYKGELNFNRTIRDVMRENLEKLNAVLPKYSQISKIELQDKEFEKTPKKSIKRFLYK